MNLSNELLLLGNAFESQNEIHKRNKSPLEGVGGVIYVVNTPLIPLEGETQAL